MAVIRWGWGLELERAVRPLGVVVVDIDAEDMLEVATVEDQQPVEALGTHRSDEAFGDRVRLGRADGVGVPRLGARPYK